MLPGRKRPARYRIVVRVSFECRSEAVPFTLMAAVRGTLRSKFLKHPHDNGKFVSGLAGLSMGRELEGQHEEASICLDISVMMPKR